MLATQITQFKVLAKNSQWEVQQSKGKSKVQDITYSTRCNKQVWYHSTSEVNDV